MSKTVNTKGASSMSVSSPRKDFLLATTNMSWQLAVVVLIPIIGGFKIDQYFNSLPVGTIIGFILAMTGMGVVVWRQLQLLAPKTETKVDTK